MSDRLSSVATIPECVVIEVHIYDVLNYAAVNEGYIQDLLKTNVAIDGNIYDVLNFTD